MHYTTRRYLILGLFGLLAIVLTRYPQAISLFPSSDHYRLRPYTYSENGIQFINITTLFNQYTNLDRFSSALLSKAWPSSPYGVKVVPYFHRKSSRFSRSVVTLTTWTTCDRIDRLVELAELKRGPISVAIYIDPEDSEAAWQFEELTELIRTKPSLSDYADIHLVTSDRPLLHNTWRNVARAFATTEWVMMWDIDFEPCTDYQAGFKKLRRSGDKELVQRLDQGKAALVIPPFEWVQGMGEGVCPKDKQDLVQQYYTMTLDAFESTTPVLSHATDYEQFMSTREDESPYIVEEYELGYEIYGIFKQDASFWCDERFAGPGFNRAACAASMYLSGMEFYVMPNQWTFLKPHPENSAKIRHSLDTNLAWKTFRIDACHAAADELAMHARLHHPAGQRILVACQGQDIPELERDLEKLAELSMELGP